MVNRKERLELDTLSKEIFGSSSRWQKLVTKGYSEALTEEKTETMPPAKEGDEPTTKQVQVPVQATDSGGQKYVTKYHTVESVREFMLEQKRRFAEIRAQIQKHQDELKIAKEAEDRAKQLQQEASGSAKV